VIANWPPMEYEIHARSMTYGRFNNIPISPHPLPQFPDSISNKIECKAHLTKHINQLWQKEWDDLSTKGQWTKVLIPKVGTHIFPTTYWTTQMLTGHGSFGQYLKFTHNRKTAACQLCNFPEGTPEHALFHCPTIANTRPNKEALTPNSSEFRRFVTLTMKKRALEEHSHQTQHKLTSTSVNIPQ